ncbi:MAG: hypothetical protein ACRDI2_04820 [Chloroflexota bacterium]
MEETLEVPAAGESIADGEAARDRAHAHSAAHWVVAPLEEEHGPVALDRTMLQTLLAINRGRRTVEEIANGRGLVETTHALARLRDLGLVKPERAQPPDGAGRHDA